MTMAVMRLRPTISTYIKLKIRQVVAIKSNNSVVFAEISLDGTAKSECRFNCASEAQF